MKKLEDYYVKMPFRAEKGDTFGWHKKARGQAQLLESYVCTHTTMKRTSKSKRTSTLPYSIQYHTENFCERRKTTYSGKTNTFNTYSAVDALLRAYL